MPAGLIVTLDGRVRTADEPLVRGTDPALTRGEAVFETALVRDGHVCLLREHLARLLTSARIAGLPAPDAAAFDAAARAAVTGWPEGEAVLRLVHGRGVGFAAISPVPERAVAARRDGVAAVTLAAAPPDALAGAKSLSYARHCAALREAARRGAGDAIYLDADGQVLEGPRSSVVIADGETLLSPPSTLPILPGTTVAALFRTAPRVAHRRLAIADLLAAQGVWLLSAVTLVSRVHTLDGVALAQAPLHTQLTAWVDAAVGRRE
ncbi:aminotransferase class IV [Mycolicibacterium sp. J2]|uniref:aminotransferase class IV n=1 Tax=Mycolicibacterium sp. J2 TaxID=2993511 RepID=UPI00224B83AD|nr:aminotransferase class IV [Mycolicibacterium sp. J2]MCX2712255.1 aminotransferase class IV [Mycolicibacterium sp. J2]